ncbi:acyl-CoA dehydrogenase [Nocardia elegans]|nr:acyl-CoA dehydrogenase [Nocardia elegans]
MMSAVFARDRDRHPPRRIATWDPRLWEELSELGLTRLTGSERTGGSGAGWTEASELLRTSVIHAVRVPLAEHDLLAGWLLETAGLPVDEARRTVCVLPPSGIARGVPWASEAERIVTVGRARDTYLLADLPAAELHITPGVNAAGEPRDTVATDITAHTAIPVSENVIRQLWLRGALIRAIQVCAALEQCLELSIRFACERIQFGRPLARFQAVQHLLADTAAEVSLARAATESALSCALRRDWTGADVEFAVAVARSCGGHAASVVVRNAHQVHGAIGTTLEHRLHEFTRPALAWRSEFGSVRHWDEHLTTAAITAGRDGLWPLITSSPAQQQSLPTIRRTTT